MLQISTDEYRRRLQSLQASVADAGLDLFIVSAFDSDRCWIRAAGAPVLSLDSSPMTRPIFCTNRSESLHRSLGL